MLNEVVEYRGYELIVCSSRGPGLWRVLIQARTGVPALCFFGGRATREEALDAAKLRINEALELAYKAPAVGETASSGVAKRLKRSSRSTEGKRAR